MRAIADRAHEIDVAIVGAGAAGLMAARILSRAGLHVALYEARGRAGGRMWTHDDATAGAPIEYGPEFVHGLPEITLALLRESGDTIVENGVAAFERTLRGLEASPGDPFAEAEALLRAAAHLAEDRTVDAYLEKQRRDGADARVLDRTRELIAGFDAADPARASARAIADEWLGDASADGSQSRPMRGYSHLIAHLVRTLDPVLAPVRLSSVVSRVAWDATGVALEFETRGRRERVFARAAIVTVPLGVLHASSDEAASIAFDPPLPAAHLRALAHLEMGPVRKVVLHFATAFWETLDDGRYRDAAFFATAGPFPTIWTQAPVRARILTAWAGGPAALALASLDRDAAIAAALATVEALFDSPEVREHFVRGYEHDWQRDPFSRGAYSYALVDAGDARARLARPIGDRLFLAGEATARVAEGGTVAGALESGERAARAVVRALAASC